MHFLVIDSRFNTPIYVFLEIDPRGSANYPELAVREVAIELVPASDQSERRYAIGRNPQQLSLFREFFTDGAADKAGFSIN